MEAHLLRQLANTIPPAAPRQRAVHAAPMHQLLKQLRASVASANGSMDGFGIVGTGVGRAQAQASSQRGGPTSGRTSGRRVGSGSALRAAAASSLGGGSARNLVGARRRAGPGTSAPRASGPPSAVPTAPQPSHMQGSGVPSQSGAAVPAAAAAAPAGAASSTSVGHTGRTPGTDPVPGAVARKATGMARASAWSSEVENNFRLQEVGWRDLEEYRVAHGEPERWKASGFIAVLKSKGSGNYIYFDRARECEDKFVHRVKLYTYAS